MYRIAWSRETRVPRERAFAWLADFTESDHWGPRWQEFARGVQVGFRRVVSRGEDEVVYEDSWTGRPPVRVVARLEPPSRIAFSGSGDAYEFRSEWRFRDGPRGGCVVEGTEEHRLFGLVNVLLEKRYLKEMEELYAIDREIHFGEMEDELLTKEATA